MIKFKAGDVVIRVDASLAGYRGMYLGDCDLVVSVHDRPDGRQDLHLAKYGIGHAGRCFALVSDDVLPPAPRDVSYLDQFTAVTGYKSGIPKGQGLRVRQDTLTQPLLSFQVAGGVWVRLDADSALQLAHDIRRMAMEIKRQEKADA